MAKKPRTYTSRSGSGEELNARWNVGATQSRYHRDGKFFMPVHAFPAAFFDPNGYLLLRTEKVYMESPYINIGKRVNVPGGISAVPGYVRVRR